MRGLPSTPHFDPAHLGKGQAIQAWSGSQVRHDDHHMGRTPDSGTVTAASIHLKHEGAA